MMLSKDAIADVVEVIRPGDFYRPAHQLIYDAILDLYARGEPADAITVSDELTRSGQLHRVGGAALPPHPHLDRAHRGERRVLRRDRGRARHPAPPGHRRHPHRPDGVRDASGVDDVVGTVDEVVDRAQAEIYDVTERRTSEDYVHIESLLQATLDEIEKISATGGVGTGIPTGFHQLDEIHQRSAPGADDDHRRAAGYAARRWRWTLRCHTDRLDDHGRGRGRRSTARRRRPAHPRRRGDGDPPSGPCYEVEFSDGTVITADAEHQWRDDHTRRSTARSATCGALDVQRPIAAEPWRARPGSRRCPTRTSAFAR